MFRKTAQIRRVLCLTLYIIFLVSCAKMDSPSQPAGYNELVDIYAQTKEYTSLEDGGTKVNFEFRNGTALTIYQSDIAIEDCTESTPKIVAWNKENEWIVAGVSTGIGRDLTLTNEEALPVYSYYDKETFVVYLSNDNRLIFRYFDLLASKSVPVVYITTEGGKTIEKETYVNGTVKIEDPDLKYGTTEKFEASMRIKGRGNSTWGMPKKPWKIKLDEKASIFGMDDNKEWCLLANYCDKSLLRNMVAMELSRMVGMAWTPGMYPVEVWLNNQYQGLYLWSETVKVGKHRVNIEVDNGDILFEVDENQDEAYCWWTTHGAPIMFKEPEEPDAATGEYAEKYFEDFETALWNKEFDKAYGMMDETSFINNYIVQELTKNVDGNLRRSTYISLRKGGKLTMDNIWDFDISLGNCDYYGDGLKAWEGWWIKDRGSWGLYHGWYYRLFMDPYFTAKVKARWNELYPQFKEIPEYIKQQKRMLGDSPARNFQKWDILNTYVWPNAKVTGSYDGEVDWLLESYTSRLSWLNAKINAL